MALLANGVPTDVNAGRGEDEKYGNEGHGVWPEFWEGGVIMTRSELAELDGRLIDTRQLVYAHLLPLHYASLNSKFPNTPPHP